MHGKFGYPHRYLATSVFILFFIQILNPVGVLIIDLAKNEFALHGVGHKGHTVLCKLTVSRAKLLEAVASMPSCLTGMEARGGAQFLSLDLYAKFDLLLRYHF